jgi:hypothetical protein
MLIHFHETLSSNIDLLKDILLHPDIMLLVVAEQGTVGADALLAVNANDFNLPMMHRAHV